MHLYINLIMILFLGVLLHMDGRENEKVPTHVLLLESPMAE